MSRSTKRSHHKAAEFLEKWWPVVLLFLISISGAYLFFIPEINDMVLSFLPFFSIFIAFTVGYYHKKWNSKFAIYLLVVFTLAFLIESLAVYTGWIFGRYNYVREISLNILNVPVIHPFNWVIIIYLSGVLFYTRYLHRIIRAFAGACLFVLTDALLQPLAIEFSIMEWYGSEIPLHNYIGKFIVSFLFLTGFYYTKFKKKNPAVIPVTLFYLVLLLGLNFLR